MHAPKVDPTKLANLRRDAELHLKEGTAPRSAGWSVGVNALSLLHELASRPESAVDALKLLHELQVYQIELDLQNEHIETSQRELAEDLARYRELYDSAPVAYLSLSPQRDILECNLAALQLFEISEDELRGRSFDSLLAPASRPLVLTLMQRLRTDGTSGSCEVQLNTGYGAHKMQVVGRATTNGNSFPVVLVDLPVRR